MIFLGTTYYYWANYSLVPASKLGQDTSGVLGNDRGDELLSACFTAMSHALWMDSEVSAADDALEDLHAWFDEPENWVPWHYDKYPTPPTELEEAVDDLAISAADYQRDAGYCVQAFNGNR